MLALGVTSLLENNTEDISKTINIMTISGIWNTIFMVLFSLLRIEYI